MAACCWQVDIFSRGVWRHYPQSVQDSLEVCMLDARSWVGLALDADDPELAPASEEEEEEEAPLLTEEETLDLMYEMGGGFFDEEPEPEPEPRMVPGRRPQTSETTLNLSVQ